MDILLKVNNLLSNLPFHIKPLFAILLSLSLLFFHSIKFKFLLNKNSVYLTLMLPVIILIVTQTIATNLFLSLGLIGALSIVRYRTPVKSQYELAYLFALIGIGIVSGVNVKYAIYLTLLLIIIPLLYELIIVRLFKNITEEPRFFGDGKTQLNVSFKIKDFKSLDLLPVNGRLLRLDQYFQEDVISCLYSFDSMIDATNFKNNLNVDPISLSITSA